MSKKKINLKFVYDAPVTLSFILLSIVLFLIAHFAPKVGLQSVLASPTNSTGSMPFSFTNLKSVFGLFLYIFGGKDEIVFFTNLLFVALICPKMEERYGSVAIGVMTIVSGFFAGVLNACFCSKQMTGCSALVFMLVLLDALLSISKNKITGTSIVMVALFITKEAIMKNPNGAIGVIVVLCGGLCGSLFAFLASPKARAERKSNKSKIFVKEKEVKKEKIKKEDKSVRRPAPKDDDTTVVGTLKF